MKFEKFPSRYVKKAMLKNLEARFEARRQDSQPKPKQGGAK